jgi:LPPG:FO 2-phospho-L-lactate transferase
MASALEQHDGEITGPVTVLCGGVGAARFLTGAIQVVDPASITAIVNTADDAVINGLAISPDLDTVRPSGSAAAVTWFRLGDRDIATHLYRTVRRNEGATLTEISDEIRRAWNVGVRVLPMTDGTVATRLLLPDGSELAFQDYFVRLQHGVEVAGVRIDVGSSTATNEVIASIDGAGTIVVAPSNPLVSIQPLRSLPGMDDALARRRDRVVAVSPIVGGHALKGPAERMLRELGHEATVVGIAQLYADIASVLVIDPVDTDLASDVEAAGMRAVVAPSVMSTPEAAAALAWATLTAV